MVIIIIIPMYVHFLIFLNKCTRIYYVKQLLYCNYNNYNSDCIVTLFIHIYYFEK